VSATYAIIIERGETGTYGASCPALPGCVAVADTLDACVQLMREAIEFHIEGLREDGQPIPHPDKGQIRGRFAGSLMCRDWLHAVRRSSRSA
jgi:predicted RNase H-like HicB family nuclease